MPTSDFNQSTPKIVLFSEYIRQPPSLKFIELVNGRSLSGQSERQGNRGIEQTLPFYQLKVRELAGRYRD